MTHHEAQAIYERHGLIGSSVDLRVAQRLEAMEKQLSFTDHQLGNLIGRLEAHNTAPPEALLSDFQMFRDAIEDLQSLQRNVRHVLGFRNG